MGNLVLEERKFFSFCSCNTVAWTEISFVHMKDGTALNAPVDELCK